MILVYLTCHVEKIMAQSQDIDSAEIAQPLITCIQIMIVNLLQSWKVESTACFGHSSGRLS